MSERFRISYLPRPGEDRPPLPLSPQQIKILRYVGQGLTHQEIAELIDISVKTVNSHIGRAFDKLGVRDGPQAVLEAIRTGQLKPEEILDADTYSRISDLFTRELEVLQVMTQDDAVQDTDEQIPLYLRLLALQKLIESGDKRALPAVNALIFESFRKEDTKVEEGTDKKHQLTKREMEILKLLALGLKDKEIARKLFLSVKTIKEHKTQLFGKMDSHTSLRAVLTAIQHRVLSLQEIVDIEDAKSMIKTLTITEGKVLKAMIETETGRNQEIAQELGISVLTVKAHLTSAYRKLEAQNRTRAALIYYAATTKQEENMVSE